MGKEKKKSAEWTVFLQGSLVALSMYLVGLFTLALLLVKGVLPENAMVSVVAVLCLVAALGGGVLTAGRSSWGTLPAAVLNAMIFVGILIVAGAACWQGICWTGHSWILLACALSGGVLAGLLGGRKGRKRKRGKMRATVK